MAESHPLEADPSTIEERVREIWRDVFGLTDERPDATFFDLQGQSISAVRIVNRIEDELGIEVDVGLLFEDPDVTTFAQAVAEQARAAGA